MNILVLGSSGLLGNAIFNFLSDDPNFVVHGSIRNSDDKFFFRANLCPNLHIVGSEFSDLNDLILTLRPAVVVNCIGVIKQLEDSENPLVSIPINSLLPHQLAKICKSIDARLIHFSTDCVFSGSKGHYSDFDIPDARDIYGLSKYLGEVGSENCITLRTSIFGHELNSSKSLLSWFLSQSGRVPGFTKAIFSGLPTTEIARVIQKYVLRNPKLSGVYNLSGPPISKYELLNICQAVYGRSIQIEADDGLVIDRSLNSASFQVAAGYKPQDMRSVVSDLRENYKGWGFNV